MHCSYFSFYTLISYCFIDYWLWIRFPFIACEIFTCEIDVILKTLVEEEEVQAHRFFFVLSISCLIIWLMFHVFNTNNDIVILLLTTANGHAFLLLGTRPTSQCFVSWLFQQGTLKFYCKNRLSSFSLNFIISSRLSYYYYYFWFGLGWGTLYSWPRNFSRF